MNKLLKIVFSIAIFSGAAVVSDLNVIEDARAEGTSIWATGSESEVSELDRELSSE